MWSPSRPYGVDLCSLCRLQNEVDIGVVVIVRSARHLDELIRQLNVLGVDSDILGRRHGHQRDGSVVAERTHCPHSHTPDELHRRQTVVGDQDAAAKEIVVEGADTNSPTC